MVTIAPLGNPVLFPKIALAAIVLFLTTTLLVRRIPGALLIGIVAGTLLSFIPFFHARGTSLEVLNLSLAPTFLKLDLPGALNWSFASLILTLLFVDFFDTAGTVVGLSVKAGFVDEKGDIPRLGRVLAADSIGPVVASLFGTSTVTSYIESAAGIEAGGRTGLTSVVTGILFLLAVFAAPLVGYIPAVVIAPVLVIVGIMMMESVTRISFSDYTEAVPALITITVMPFTYSISNGIFLGFTSYTVLKLLTGKIRDLHPVMIVLSLLFLLFFLLSPVYR